MTDEYNQRIEAAVSQFEDAKDAAFGILTGDENTDIPVPGFVDQPTLAKRFKQAFAPLAGDLANSTDPAKGAALIGRAVTVVPSIAQLLEQLPKNDALFLVKSYHAGTGLGGGLFQWEASRPKATHEGVLVFDPGRPFPVDWGVDSDVAEWFSASTAGEGCFVRVGVTVLSPEMAGAIPAPGNSSRQFTALAEAMTQCAVVQMHPRATYRATRFAAPAYAVIRGNNALIERQAQLPEPLVSAGMHSIIEDLHVDGRNGAGVAGSSIRELGIALDSYSIARRCTATRTYGHGLGNRSVALALTYTDITFEDCVGYSCGANPSPAGTGTGDGLALVNTTRGRFIRCRGVGNARSGITATTYDTATELPDVSLSADVLFEDCSASGNAYAAEINAEKVTRPQFIRCRAEKRATFRGSPDTYMVGGFYGGVSGVDGADRPTLDGVVVADESTGYEALVLTGASPQVSNVRVSTNITPATLNLVQILPTDSKGHVVGLTTVGGNNAVRLDVNNFSGISISGNSGLGLVLGPSGSTRSFAASLMPTMANGKLRGFGDQPTTGTHNVGDRVENRLPAVLGTAGSQFIVQGWVCTVAGTPGTWVPQRTMTGS